MNDRMRGMNGCLKVGCLRKGNADFHDHHDLSGFLARSIMINLSNHDDLRSFVTAANTQAQLKYKTQTVPSPQKLNWNAKADLIKFICYSFTGAIFGASFIRPTNLLCNNSHSPISNP